MNKNLLFLSFILIISFIGIYSVSSNQENKKCGEAQLKKYISYRKAISDGKDTINYFNLKYLINEMRSVDILKDQYKERLTSYTYEIDIRQSKVISISGSFARCGSDYTRLMLETKHESVDSKVYILVNFVDEKIVNISKEDLAFDQSGNSEFLKDYNYIPVSVDFTENDSVKNDGH